MTSIYEDPFYAVALEPDGMVVLRRSDLRVPSLDAQERSLDSICEALRLHLPTKAGGLLVDMRDAPPRNDDAFESTVRRFRTEIHAHFVRVAVVVRTIAGKLQVNRLDREQHLDTATHAVFDDEDEARAFLSRARASA